VAQSVLVNHAVEHDRIYPEWDLVGQKDQGINGRLTEMINVRGQMDALDGFLQSCDEADEASHRKAIQEAQLSAGSTALRRMSDHNAKLLRMFANLEFKLQETILERTMLEEELVEKAKADQPPSSTSHFFAILNSFEAQESSVKAEITTKQQKLGDLIRYNRTLSEKSNGVQGKLELKSHLLSRLQEENQSMRDLTVDINSAIAERRAYQVQLATATSSLARELQSRASIVAGSAEHIEKLRSDNARLKELLEARKRERSDVSRKIAERERMAEIRQKKNEDALKTALSLRTWQVPRRKLHTTVNAAVKQNAAVVKALDIVMRRGQHLAKQIVELLEGDDPGDGSGEAAMKIVQAEIVACQAEVRNGVAIETEEDYARDLQRQLNVVLSTRATLNGWRSETLTSLRNELVESGDTGYLSLLTSEYNRLKTGMARTL
jgi:predicted nuclease with TOPRIM domain